MDKLWILIGILVVTCLKENFAAPTLEQGSAVLNFTATDNYYTIYMNENNHNFTDRSEILKIVDATSAPTVTFVSSTSFQRTIESNGDNTYTFYATQYFDYDTTPVLENSYAFYFTIDQVQLFVGFNILNIDDEPPSLSNPQCNFKENEFYTAQNTTCSCTLSDPDGWIQYSSFQILENSGNETEIFGFEFDTMPDDLDKTAEVKVTVRQMLDYETTTFYSFDVMAKDGAGHNTTPNAEVRSIVYVIDVNDMPPEFTNYFTTTQFYEEQPMTFSVTARDGDKGIDAPIYYKINQTDQPEYVTIDEGTGVISVEPIDRDADDISTYKFTVVAFENDSLPFFETPLDITFFIEDIDDNEPLVIQVLDSDKNINKTYPRSHDTDVDKIMQINFDENFDGSLNGIIFFNDTDTGTNAQFVVELEDIDGSAIKYTEAFLVAPTAGYRGGEFQVSVRNSTKLDYEDPPWINFQFKVHSYGTLNSSRQDIMIVNVSLNDINDEVPIFPKSEYSVDINETLGKGEFIIQVMAKDKDYEDRILKHDLVGSNVITQRLTIDSANGSIYVSIDNAFDFDTINPLFVQVRATDKVNHTTTVPVTINLLDVNNKSPTITVDGTIEVDENQKKGALLNSSIIASDVDTTRKLSAEIDWDNSYAMKNSRRLDMTNDNIRNLVEFLDLTYEEIGPNGNIQIMLTVNSNVPTEDTPDFELFDSLFLRITVTDWNTDPAFIATNQNTSTLILISIGDLNDNPPIFTEETITANRTVSEGALANVIVGSVIATDADVGDNITYTCEALEEEFDWFIVNSATGTLTVKSGSNIDADTDRKFYVNYTCYANDSIHVTPLSIAMYILDTNNKKPKIAYDPVVHVVEKSGNGTEFYTIGTSDEDRDIPFNTVQCYLNVDSDCYGVFDLTATTNVLTVGRVKLDRDNGPANYTCEGYCTDNPGQLQGGVQNQEDINFVVKLDDINDNAPELLTFELSVTENTAMSGEIGKILARDIDEGDNATIEFHITHVYKENNDSDDTEYPDLFKITNESDYEVDATHKMGTVSAKIDLKDHYGTYIVHLNLTDKGTPVMFNDTYTLKIEIERFNYYQPAFTFPTPDNTTLVLRGYQEVGRQLYLYRNSTPLPDISVVDNEKLTCSGKWADSMAITVRQTSPTDSSIFAVGQTSDCAAQLRVNDNYNTETAINNTYELVLAVALKDGENEDTEEPFTNTFTVTVSFFDNTQAPVFTYDSYQFGFLEDNITVGIQNDTQQLPDQAIYQTIPEGGISINYLLDSSNTTISSLFAVEVSDGSISHNEPLDYLTDKQFTFRIRATNPAQPITTTEKSYLTIVVDVIDINNHAPVWTSELYYGAITSSYTRGTSVLTISATDLDEIDQGKITYNIVEDTFVSNGTGISNVAQNGFQMDSATGEIKLNFTLDNLMQGYFTFDIQAQDVKDDYGNPAHQIRTSVTIFIISSDNTVRFRFRNTLEQVLASQNTMLQKISDALGYDCHAQTIDWDSQNGIQLNNQTVASVYCVKDNTTIDASIIQRQISNVNTFMSLSNALMSEDQLYLMNFDTETVSENTETVLRAWLVGVSVVLGALCVILLVTFILKMRELNRRISKLTSNKFGSQESGLNRIGISAPTANKRAVEGSNPVFNNDVVKNKDIDVFDRESIRSGDSDLIGIEDSPEFDFFDNRNKERF